jgi:hypothetical protein
VPCQHDVTHASADGALGGSLRVDQVWPATAVKLPIHCLLGILLPVNPGPLSPAVTSVPSSYHLAWLTQLVPFLPILPPWAPSSRQHSWSTFPPSLSLAVLHRT